MITTKEEVKIEKISETFIRIIFNPEQHHITHEISDSPSFFDTIIPHNAAEINFALRYAGIIDINLNPLLIDAETVEKLIDTVLETID